MENKTQRGEQTVRYISIFIFFAMVLFRTFLVHSQTVVITNDQDVALTGIQVVNVGEHVRANLRVEPLGTSFSNPQWAVTGLHIKDWITKDMEPLPMLISDHLGESIHLIWKETIPIPSPNILYVSVLVGTTVISTQVEFQVERQPKPEKFYSDDLLMENHNNWHAVYMFWASSRRRGDLFLTWHRSQLEYFNAWREYFGYSSVPFWDPATSWAFFGESPSRQHPSTIPALPATSFSTRHDLITLDLSNQGLGTSTEGEYDLVTQGQNRGRRTEFANAGYIVRTETVREVAGIPATPNFSFNGIATLPAWWQVNTGQTANETVE